jgi:hypothetical protein
VQQPSSARPRGSRPRCRCACTDSSAAPARAPWTVVRSARQRSCRAAVEVGLEDDVPGATAAAIERDVVLLGELARPAEQRQELPQAVGEGPTQAPPPAHLPGQQRIDAWTRGQRREAGVAAREPPAGGVEQVAHEVDGGHAVAHHVVGRSRGSRCDPRRAQARPGRAGRWRRPSPPRARGRPPRARSRRRREARRAARSARVVARVARRSAGRDADAQERMPGLDRIERPPQRGLVEVAGDVRDGDELQRLTWSISQAARSTSVRGRSCDCIVFASMSFGLPVVVRLRRPASAAGTRARARLHRPPTRPRPPPGRGSGASTCSRPKSRTASGHP